MARWMRVFIQPPESGKADAANDTAYYLKDPAGAEWLAQKWSGRATTWSRWAACGQPEYRNSRAWLVQAHPDLGSFQTIATPR